MDQGRQRDVFRRPRDRDLRPGVDMKWVTRRGIRVNRAATAWLIRRFIDRDATLRFVDPEEVATIQRREGAKGFDAPGAMYPHQEAQSRCSFEALVAEHCADDAALVELARIVRGADFRDQIDLTRVGGPSSDLGWVPTRDDGR